MHPHNDHCPSERGGVRHHVHAAQRHKDPCARRLIANIQPHIRIGKQPSRCAENVIAIQDHYRVRPMKQFHVWLLSERCRKDHEILSRRSIKESEKRCSPIK